MKDRLLWCRGSSILYDKTVNPNDLSAYKESFLQSAKKHIDDAEHNLNLLRTNKETSEIINELYLHLHSLKGECNVMGYNETGLKCEQILLILKSEQEKPTTSRHLILSLKIPIETIKKELNSIENESSISNIS